MKKLYVLSAVALLLSFGCAQTEVVPVQAGAKPTVNMVDSIKAGKEEGAIDKEFFKKILVEKPSNVFLVDVRTPFEYKAGHFDGAKHVFINDLYDKGCDATLAQIPKEGYVVFVCATGARAGEMYSGILDDCKGKADAKRLFFLDAEVAYTPTGPVIR
jgi:hydroxyacylglutathione hydrolase